MRGKKLFIFLQGRQQKVDFTYFRQMAIEFFQSDDPESPGNFINGQTDYS